MGRYDSFFVRFFPRNFCLIHFFDVLDDYSSRSRAPSSMNVGQQEYGSRTPPASLPRTPQNGDQTPHSFVSFDVFSVCFQRIFFFSRCYLKFNFLKRCVKIIFIYVFFRFQSSEPTYSRVQKKNNRQQLSVPAQSPGYTTNGSKTPTAQPQALDSWV